MACFTQPPSMSQLEWILGMLKEVCNLCKVKLEFSELSEEEFTEKLCFLCRELTKDQMMNIRPSNERICLFEWYKHHVSYDLMNAETETETEFYKKEINRIGGKVKYEKDKLTVRAISYD